LSLLPVSACDNSFKSASGYCFIVSSGFVYVPKQNLPFCGVDHGSIFENKTTQEGMLSADSTQEIKFRNRNYIFK
jgi:hypothetical protein